MNKKILLIVIISTYIIVMSSSVSAVEYRVVDDHNITAVSSAITKIGKTIEKCISFFKNTKREMARFIAVQDGKILAGKLADVRTLLDVIAAEPASIGLMLQFIIGLIASVVIIVFLFGTTLSVLFASFVSLFIVTLVSLGILLIRIIRGDY